MSVPALFHADDGEVYAGCCCGPSGNYVVPYDDLDRARKELSDADDKRGKLLAIAAVINAYHNADNPEGGNSERMTIRAIGDILGEPF